MLRDRAGEAELRSRTRRCSYRADRAHKVLKADEELTGDDLLADFRCRVADFFFMPGKKKPA